MAVLVDNFQLALEESSFGISGAGEIDFTDPVALGLDTTAAEDDELEETHDGPSSESSLFLSVTAIMLISSKSAKIIVHCFLYIN